MIEVFPQPALRQYRRSLRIGRGARIAPSGFPSSSLAAADILRPPGR